MIRFTIIKFVAAGSIMCFSVLCTVDVFNVYLFDVKALIVAKCCYGFGALCFVNNVVHIIEG